MKKSESKIILSLVVLSLLPRIGYFLYHSLTQNGLPVAFDTEWYLKYAYGFLDTFHVELELNSVFYLAYYSLLSVMLLIFRTYEAVVLVQMIINALTVILVYKLALVLFNRRTAIFSGIFFALNIQVIKWSIFIITDSLFVTLLLVNVYTVVMFFKSHLVKYKYAFLGSALAMILFRPTGIVALTFIFAYIMINLNYKKAAAFWKGRRLAFLSVGMAAFLGGTIYVLSSGRLSPLFHNLDMYLRWLLIEYYATGRIFDIPTPYDYSYKAVMDPNILKNYHIENFPVKFVFNNWMDIMILFGIRTAAFFGLWILRWDELNFLVKLKYLVPFLSAALLMGLGTVAMVRRRLFKEASVLYLTIASILVFCIIFFMDAAYRYRMPSMVFFGIIIAYGLDTALDRISGRLKEPLAEAGERIGWIRKR